MVCESEEELRKENMIIVAKISRLPMDKLSGKSQVSL